MKIINKYVLREHVGPLTFALTALTSLLLLNYIAKQFGNLVGKGLGPQIIGEFFALSVPFTVAMTLPMAVLVATLYAFSRLASENEITALKANGVSMVRLLVPVLLAASVLALTMVAFNDQVLPRSNHALRTLQSDIARKKPTFSLRQQVINEVAPGKFYLRANHIAEFSNKMREVTIYDLSDPLRRRTIYADSGDMELAANQKDLLLTLYVGYMQEVPKTNVDQLQRLFYKVDRIRVAGVANQLERTDNDDYKSDREMSVCEMEKQHRDHELDLAVARFNLQQALVAAVHEAVTGAPAVIESPPGPPPSSGLAESSMQAGRTIQPRGFRWDPPRRLGTYYCSMVAAITRVVAPPAPPATEEKVLSPVPVPPAPAPGTLTPSTRTDVAVSQQVPISTPLRDSTGPAANPTPTPDTAPPLIPVPGIAPSTGTQVAGTSPTPTPTPTPTLDSSRAGAVNPTIPNPTVAGDSAAVAVVPPAGALPPGMARDSSPLTALQGAGGSRTLTRPRDTTAATQPQPDSVRAAVAVATAAAASAAATPAVPAPAPTPSPVVQPQVDTSRRPPVSPPATVLPQPATTAVTPPPPPMYTGVSIPNTPFVVYSTIESSRIRMRDNKREMNEYAVEIHKKFALSAACVVFVLIGAPIALRFPRGGVGLTIGVSLIVFAIYYVGLIAGEALADRGFLTPFWAMWAANVLFTIVGLTLLARMGKEAGTSRGGDIAELIETVTGWFRRSRQRSTRITIPRTVA